MSTQDREKWQETALVDISYEVLDRADRTLNYKDIFNSAAELKGLTQEELMELLPQVYTEMNLDGRFICISPGEWGLKKWYSTESIEESVEALARSRGIDDDDEYGFDEEDLIDEDYIGEDYDILKADDDDDEDVDEDVDVEEDELLEEDLVDDEFGDDEEDAVEFPDEEEADDEEDFDEGIDDAEDEEDL